MVVGVILTSLWAFFHYQDKASCPSGGADVMVACSVVMYGSYFYLFASFYVKRYWANRNATGATKTTKSA